MSVADVCCTLSVWRLVEEAVVVERDLESASLTVSRRFAVGMLRQDGRRVGLAALWHLVSAFCLATTPYFVGKMVGLAAADGEASTLWRLGGIALAIAAFGAVMAYVAQRLTAQSIQAAVCALRDRVVEAIVELPLSVVERVGTGALVSRTTRDTSLLIRTTEFGVPQTLTVVAAMVATVIAVPLVCGWTALAALPALPWVFFVYRRHFRKSRPGFARLARHEEKTDALLNETVDSASVIDALGVSEVRQRRYLDALRRSFTAHRYLLYQRHIFFPTPTSALYVATILSVLWGFWLYGRGWATLDQVTAIGLYLLALAPMLTMLGFTIDELQSAETALGRLVGVLNADSGTSGTAKPNGSAIDFQGVSFEYRPGVPVLRDVSLTISPGERVVIVGPSGSGKSTIARLLAGVSAPSAGRVAVGGVDVSDVSAADLPKSVMMLTQEQHVFRGDLRRNLKLAAPDATDEQLFAALDTVGAMSWVAELPDGLAQRADSGDFRLSPGQAQQVALARVLLADPQIVVLDEATSLVDGAQASAIERSLDEALTGRTVVAIAHRLSAAERADRVLVVEDGRIVEEGPHGALLEFDGKYAQLWARWEHGR